MSTEFKFGNNSQPGLFDAAEVFSGETPEHHSGEGGSIPTQPLQPKQLRLEPIDRATARNIWLNKHYLHRDFANPSLELGVFSPDMKELVGAIAYSAPLGGSVKGGKPNTWEIRRMWLSDERCAKNSESRVLAISFKFVRRLAPHVKYIVSFSDDTNMGHQGTIYKASGFRYCGRTLGAKTGEKKNVRGWLSHGSHKVSDGFPKRKWIKQLFWDADTKGGS